MFLGYFWGISRAPPRALEGARAIVGHRSFSSISFTVNPPLRILLLEKLTGPQYFHCYTERQERSEALCSEDEGRDLLFRHQRRYVKADSHIACHAHSVPLQCNALNSHMPCRAPAMLRQCRDLRESPRGSRKYPSC
jgi:hypothetical protein